MELISTECIDAYDPPQVLVTVKVGDIIYTFLIPASVYPEIGAPLGWPTNPCTR